MKNTLPILVLLCQYTSFFWFVYVIHNGKGGGGYFKKLQIIFSQFNMCCHLGKEKHQNKKNPLRVWYLDFLFQKKKKNHILYTILN